MAQSGTRDARRQFRDCPGIPGRLANLDVGYHAERAVLFCRLCANMCKVWVLCCLIHQANFPATCAAALLLGSAKFLFKQINVTIHQE